MTKNLLYKTQRVYLIFSIAVFIVVAPLFYIITEKLYIKDTDETLITYKTEFLKKYILKLKETDIPVWNKFNNDIKIIKTKGLTDDSIFNTSHYNITEQENEPYRELYSPVIIEGKPYTFSVGVNMLESEDLMISIALLFIVIIILLLSGLFFINKELSLSLWKPFYTTLQQIEDFEIDKYELPQLSETKIKEFNRLNNSIFKLIEKNIKIYQNQREFVENAAHELQTPIAVFQAKIDTLIQGSDITEAQSVIFASLNNTVNQLKRLNKNLLLLSKIDNNQFEKIESFSIKKLIEKQLDFFIEQAEQKSIMIKINLQNDITVNADIGLTEILVNNIFLNAVRHNIKCGELYISLSEKKLTVANTGKSKQLSEEKIFHRFSTSDSSEQGTGLGLAIVKKIADANNWSVSYSFSENLHFFSVQF